MMWPTLKLTLCQLRMSPVTLEVIMLFQSTWQYLARVFLFFNSCDSLCSLQQGSDELAQNKNHCHLLAVVVGHELCVPVSHRYVHQ